VRTASSRCRLKRSTATSGLLLLGGLAGLIGLIADQRAIATVGLALLGAVLVDALAAWVTVRAVTITLHGPPETVSGEESEWILTAAGIRRPVVIGPAVVPRSPRYLVRSGEPALITLPPFGRGLVHHVGVDITATGPLGLYQAGRRLLVPLGIPLPVGPRPVPIDLSWPRPRALSFGLTQGAPLGDDLFRSLRPYRRGDERRRIHWGATAHHGRLMVRELDGTGVVGLRVLVEPGLPGAMADHVTGVAASVTSAALARGWVVQLVTADGTTERPDPPTPSGPFGPALPQPAFQPAATTTRTAVVAGDRAAHHQLATAAQGPLVVGTWPGLTCRVTPGGVRWE
jgi:uncharacterized protein (DUF58 family)